MPLACSQVMHIGFIGLGHMGRAMAAVLIRAGYTLTVYNRTRSKAEELEKLGAQVASSPTEAARDVQVLITMVADDQAVLDTVLDEREGAINGLARDAIHLSMSTVGPLTARRLVREHDARGQHCLAAPVLGRPETAERAALVVITSGPPDLVDCCRPVFYAMAKQVYVVGEPPEMANVVKLGLSFIQATIIEALGEAYALVEPFGIEDEVFLDVLDGLLKSPVIEGYGRRIANERFEPASLQLRLGLKDVRLVLEAGESAAVPMPIASVLRDRFIAAIARGLGDADWSALARLARERNKEGKAAA